MANGGYCQLAKKCFRLPAKWQNVTFNFANTPYDVIEIIGAGAYGVVCLARNRLTGEKVAVKKTPRVFDNFAIAKRTLREIKILRYFCHNNIVSIKSLFLASPTAGGDCNELCVVFDLMETDLSWVLGSKQPLTEEHFKRFMYQLLCGLKYIHSAGVVHRDLKPSNLLVNSDCRLKIADFGMSRHLSTGGGGGGQQAPAPTMYVATRWYRAPELLLGHQSYGTSVDMWSCGCILAEMLGRQPMFPGQNFKHQFEVIVRKLGRPPAEFVAETQSETLLLLLIGQLQCPA